MRRRMVWKLAACFAAVLLLFAAVLGGVYAAAFRRHTISVNQEAMEVQAASIAETLTSFGSGMGRGRGGGYGAYLRFLNELTPAEVWIVDGDRTLLAPGRDRMVRDSLPAGAWEIVEQALSGENAWGEGFSALLDAPTLTVGVPVRTAAGVTGAVLLHSPVSGVDKAVWRALAILCAGAAAGLVLAGGAAVWLCWRFTAPLERMRRAAALLAEGDYAAKTAVNQADEIGQLAGTIDRLAEQLAAAEEQRAALDRMKQDFVANISHELRTPVAVLRGSLEVLQDGTVSEGEEVAAYYAHMLAESRHLERLVNDLLDLSRLQDGQFRLEMEEMDLCGVVRDAARAIRQSARGKAVEVSVRCPQEECLLMGDYGRVRQMLLILLDNAVKFSHPGGAVDFTLSREARGFTVEVADHGRGIPPEELPHIFDRFWRVRGGENRSGTGLGLAIARQIAKRHGAELRAESGGGRTCFTVRFPEEL